MVFEFLKWRSSIEEYKRGVKKGWLLFKRPRPLLNLASKGGWLKFLLMIFVGWFLSVLIGAIAFFVAAAATGGYVSTIGNWAFGFGVGWVVFCILHLVHSIRFYKNAKLTDVEFIPVKDASALGKRLLTMPEDLAPADYNILFSRYVWADVEGEPYRDVTEWLTHIEAVQTGAQPATESRLKEIVEMGGGIPSQNEIIKILQTELIPRYREAFGERLAMLYLIFLCTQPPTLPFSETTSRGEMREVASASDTREVLDYLKPFSEKMEEI